VPSPPSHDDEYIRRIEVAFALSAPTIARMISAMGKLFTQRGFTCTEFVYSLRLNQAARLLDRRKLLSISEPISAIAYACGFRDYTHFSRKFCRRFCYSPGAHSEARGRAGNGAVHPSADMSASRDRDSVLTTPG